MDLKTFVSETLTQIAEGIKEAQSKQDETGALFSPAHFTGDIDKTVSIGNASRLLDEFETVEFDVALTVAAQKEGEAQAGLVVFGMSLLGAKGKMANQNETVSHVKFDVIVRWPRCG